MLTTSSEHLSHSPNLRSILICFFFLNFLADRAKSIKTQAVVNESPTEKLIRELREENKRLMEQLKAGGVVTVVQDSSEAGESAGVSEEGTVIHFYFGADLISVITVQAFFT